MLLKGPVSVLRGVCRIMYLLKPSELDKCSMLLTRAPLLPVCFPGGTGANNTLRKSKS